MPLILGVIVVSAGAFGGLVWWGKKRKATGATGGASPFPEPPVRQT